MARNTVDLNLKLNVKAIEKGVSNLNKNIKGIAQGVNKMAQAGSEAQSRYSKFTSELEKFSNSLGKTFDLTKKMTSSQKKMKGLVGAFANDINQSEKAQQKLKQYIATLKTLETKKANISAGKYTFGKSVAGADLQRLEKLRQELEQILGVEDQVEQETQEMRSGFQKLGDSLMGGTNMALSQLGIETKQISSSLGVGAAAATGFGVALAVGMLAIKGTVKWLKNIRQQLQAFGQQLIRINEALRNTVSGARLATQGFLSIARAMTFFIAVPLTAFLKEGVQASLELEQALIRVQKVTGSMFEDAESLGRFKNAILDLSTVTASSAEELANYAEQLGQMGVRSEDAMMELVAIMDVVAQATDINAEDIAQDLGSIANAFGQSMSKGSQEVVNFVDNMAETINALENAVGATASDIVATMKDMGSAFSGLTAGIAEDGKTIKRMSFATIAALGAASREMGMSADEAGTALKNLPSYLIDNADVINELNIKTERFANSLQFVNGLNKDFQGTLFSLVEHLSENASTLEAVSASVDLLGRRTGRLLTNLVKMASSAGESGDSLGRLGDIVELANKAWEEGRSLMSEYDKMLGTTSINLQKMRHSLEQLGATVGDDVLPVINKFIDNVSAGFLAITNIYGTMTDATKGLIGRTIGLAAAFGPVSWFLSQVAFGVTMVMNGLMRMGAVILPVLGALKMLIGGLLTLNPILIAIGGAIYSVVSQYTSQLVKLGDTVDSIMANMADDAMGWGKAIMGAFADGIQESAKIVIGSIQAITDAMALYLEAHSPPRLGALSSIDMWGEPLMNTWLAGFAEADFEMLSDVAQRVEGILTAIHFTPSSEDDDGERKKVLKDLISFREQFSKLLKDYRSGVDISQEYIDNVLEGLGDGSDELAKLINLSLEYERIQKRLAEIEDERTQISEAYENRVEAIRLSGASAEEMVESIASAQYARDRHNEALSEEETRLERREKLLERQISTQEAFLDGLQEQSDLWQEFLKMQADSGSGADDIEKVAGAFDLTNESLGELDSKLAILRERFIALKVQAQKIKGIFFVAIEAVKGLWAVIFQGADPEKVFDNLFENAMAAADPVAHGADLASEYWGSFATEIDPEKDIVPQIMDNLESFGPRLVKRMSENLDESQMKEAYSQWLSDAFDLSPTEQSQMMDAFSGTIDDVVHTGISDSLLGRSGGVIAPADILEDVEGRMNTSPFETFIDSALTPLTEAGLELQSVFGEDGLISIFNNFFTAFAQGWTGMSKPEAEIAPPGQGSSGMGDFPTEEGATVNMEAIAWSLGDVADSLADSVPTILDNLGQLVENLTIFMGTLFGISDVEGETPLEKFTNLTEVLADASDTLGTLDTDAFRTAADIARIIGKIVIFFYKLTFLPAVASWTIFGGIWEKLIDFQEFIDDDLVPWLLGESNIKGAITGFIDDFKEALNEGNLFSAGWGLIKSLWKGVTEFWKAHFQPFIDRVSGLGAGLIPNFGVWKNLGEILTGSNKQGGGWAFPGQTYNVNEAKGGELFTPSFRGKITSATLSEKMMRDAGGYGGETIQINIDSPVVRGQQDIDDLVDTILYKIAEK